MRLSREIAFGANSANSIAPWREIHLSEMISQLVPSGTLLRASVSKFEGVWPSPLRLSRCLCLFLFS